MAWRKAGQDESPCRKSTNEIENTAKTRSRSMIVRKVFRKRSRRRQQSHDFA